MMQRKRLVSELFSGFTKGSEELQHLISRNHQELHKIPANIEMGINYGAKYAIYKKKANQEDPNELLSLRCNKNELSHIGMAFPLFLDFAKFSCFLIAIIATVSCLYGIITNILSGFCADTMCPDDYFIALQSLLNKQHSVILDYLQVGLNFACTMCLIIAVFFYKRNQNKILREIYLESLGPSAFTLRMRGIPKLATDQDIEAFIQRLSPSKERIKIAEIVRSYDIRRLVSYYRKLNELQAEYTRLFQLQQLNKSKKYQKTMEALLHKSGLLQISLQRMVRNEMLTTNTVFVCFEKIEDMLSVYNSAKLGPLQRLCLRFSRGPRWLFPQRKLWGKKFPINVGFAPEPTDVLWENLGTSKAEYDCRKFIGNLIVALSILVSFVLLVVVKVLQLRLADNVDETSRIPIVFSIARSLIVVIVNGGLQFIIHYMESFELKHTYSSYFFGVAAKLSISMFINSAFTSFFANIVGALIQGELNYDNLDIFFSDKGSLFDIFFIALSMAISMPLLTIFSPGWVVRRIKRSLVKKRLMKNLSQGQVNNLFQGMDFNFQSHYGNVVRLCWFCGFYAPVLPAACFLGLITIIGYYWALKYHIIRQCAVPYYRLGTNLHEKMLKFIQFTHVGFASGNVLWLYITHAGKDTPIAIQAISILTLVISMIDVFFPSKPLRELVAQEMTRNKDNLSYSEVKGRFYATYDIENPATRQQALENDFQIKSQAKKRQVIMFQHKLFEDALQDNSHKLVRSAARPSILPDEDLIDNIKMYSFTHLPQTEFKNANGLTAAEGTCRFLAKSFFNRHTSVIVNKFSLTSLQKLHDEPLVKDEDLIVQPTGNLYKEKCMQAFPQLIELALDDIESIECSHVDSGIVPSLKSNIEEFDDSTEYHLWKMRSNRVSVELSYKSPNLSPC